MSAALLLGLLLTGAQAQLHVPARWASIAPLETRPDGAWRGTQGARLSAATGNTRSPGASLSLDAVRARNDNALSMFGTGLYGASETNGDTSAAHAQWRLAARHGWDRNDSRMYLVGFGTGERGTIGHLEVRTTVGAGLGYQLLRTPDRSFEVFAGLGYRGDRYRAPGSLVEGQLLERYDAVELMLGGESASRLISNTTWQQRLMVFPNLSTGGALRATFESVVSVAMAPEFNLAVSLVNRYDSLATAPLKQNDVLIFTGINLRYGAR